VTEPPAATPPVAASPPVLVLGVGNLLLSDEGAGIHAIAAFRARYGTPDGVELVDGGTAGLDLLDIIAGRQRLIIVDAVQHDGCPAGTLLTFRDGDFRAAFAARLSPHQLGLLDVLAAAALLGESPASVTVLGIVPADLDLGLELSATVAGRFDGLLAMIADELSRCGVALPPPAADAP
jgi:hydrogenase maturation protease